MSDLAQKRCIPCTAGTPPLKGEALRKLAAQIPTWQVVNEHQIEKEVKFKNFKEALAFTNQVGNIAEAEGHHPDILLSWGKVKITLFTHKIDGLSESDFILAAKCDEITP
jgi:4a-hydroxytetrahydrobiopterin dehydratase